MYVFIYAEQNFILQNEIPKKFGWIYFFKKLHSAKLSNKLTLFGPNFFFRRFSGHNLR